MFRFDLLLYGGESVLGFRFPADLVAERGLEWRMSMHERKAIDLDRGWEFMQNGFTKLKNFLEGLPGSHFS